MSDDHNDHSATTRNREPGFDSDDASADVMPRTAWLMRRFANLSPAKLERCSRMIGLSGLVFLTLVIAGTLPFQVAWLDDVMPRNPSFSLAVPVIILLSVPAVFAYSFMMIPFVFYEGSLIVRVIMGTAVMLLVAIAILVGQYFLDGYLTSGSVVQIVEMLVGSFIGFGLVAVFCQNWTRWRLIPLRMQPCQSNRTGTRILIELTLISAVLFAMAISLGNTFSLVSIVVYACVGVPLGGIVVCALVGFLTPRPRVPVQIATVLIALLISLAFTVLVVINFDWTPTPLNVALGIVDALICTTAVLMMLSLCVLWLRMCGWQCVKLR